MGWGSGWGLEGKHTHRGKAWEQEAWIWGERDTQGVSRGSADVAPGTDPAGSAPAVELGLVQQGAGPRQALEHERVRWWLWPAQHVVAGLHLLAV